MVRYNCFLAAKAKQVEPDQRPQLHMNNGAGQFRNSFTGIRLKHSKLPRGGGNC